MAMERSDPVLGFGSNRNLPTVLLIDDDMISREVIATLLTLNGYTLHTAEDGARAVGLLEDGSCAPQVILADVQMQGLSGVDLVKEIRARSRAVIYIISGSDPPEELKGAADGFLLKPFGPEALQKLLDGHIRVPIEAEMAFNEPVISPETLGQFRQLMPEATVRDVYTAVLSDLEKRVKALEAAIADRNAAEVRKIGHTIKGGCGMAGARQAARLGALLESESDELNNSDSIRIELDIAAKNLKRMLEVEFSA
jgi:CheY-like chemotaxis protein/HPt (histidine-containing phosphotransfer) domain-containing protein